MNRIHTCFLIVTLLFTPAFLKADVQIPTIKDVLNNYRLYDDVLLTGKIEKRYKFDVFVLDDGTGKMALLMKDLPIKIKTGDIVYAFGEYQQDDDFPDFEAELDVYTLAREEETKKVNRMKNKYKNFAKKYAKRFETDKPEKKPRSIEERLNKIKKLKEQGIITSKEYETHRKRILSDL